MQQKASRSFTYQTRPFVDPKLDLLLTENAALLSKVERCLYKDYYQKNKNLNELKSNYLKHFDITARQFNSLRIKLEGKVRSYKELLNRNIHLLEDKIKKLKKHIQKLKDPFKSHQKKRRLFLLENKLKKLKKDKDENRTRICFGSKQLFQKQFHLEENGYSSLANWKEDWTKARNSSFFLVGSKDETSGNQSCQLIKKENSFFLQLRLPNTFSEKSILIENLSFAYGEEEISHSLEENEERKRLKKNKKEYSHLGKALNFLFKRDEKGWRVFVTIEQDRADLKSKNALGVIGIDINPHNIALAETDRFGNIVNKKNISYSTYGKSKSQSSAIIGDVCKEIVKFASQSQKPLCLENLDFEKKKQSLREQKSNFSRMLSSFSYNKIIESIESKSFKEGIEIYKVNPAFTSIIGKVKFKDKYGLSDHLAAALVIARRACNFSERPTSYLEVKGNKKSKSAFFLPERNRKKHVWNFYSELNKKLKAANVLHLSTIYRSSRPQDSCVIAKASTDCRGSSDTLIVNKTVRLT